MSSPDQPPNGAFIRELRRLHATAVTVVTFADDRGFRGVTVTAFAIVSLDPPRVLVCLDRLSDALAAVQTRGQFAVNVLSDRQEFLADRFAGRAPLVNARFDGAPHRLTLLGDPILTECLEWYDCRVDQIIPSGDHSIVVGAVLEANLGSGSLPLMYFDGRYRELRDA